MPGPDAPPRPAAWRGPPPTPSAGGVLGARMLVAPVGALAFGAGVAFLVLGRGLLSRAPGATRGWATAACAAIAWALVSRVPHAARHVTSAHDGSARLALIERLFRFTLVVSAAVPATRFWRVLRTGAREGGAYTVR